MTVTVESDREVKMEGTRRKNVVYFIRVGARSQGGIAAKLVQANATASNDQAGRQVSG